jgi:hypothetical protein
MGSPISGTMAERYLQYLETSHLHNEKLNDLYSSPNIFPVKKIEKNEMGLACSANGGEERRIQGFGGEA